MLKSWASQEGRFDSFVPSLFEIVLNHRREVECFVISFQVSFDSICVRGVSVSLGLFFMLDGFICQLVLCRMLWTLAIQLVCR